MTMDKYLALIERVKNGDDEAFEIILNDNRKLIYKIIYTRNLENGDFMMDTESLFQEGSIALFKACKTFETDKGMNFTSYAYMCIRSAVNTYIRDNFKRRTDEFYSIDNYSNIDYHVSMSNVCIAENPVAYHKEMEFKKHLDEFVSKLEPQDRQILEMRCDNISYKTISQRLNISTKRVDNRLRVLRKKLKAHINDEENEQ